MNSLALPSQEVPLSPNPEITRPITTLDYILIATLIIIFLALPTGSYRQRKRQLDEYQHSKRLEAGLVCVEDK